MNLEANFNFMPVKIELAFCSLKQKSLYMLKFCVKFSMFHKKNQPLIISFIYIYSRFIKNRSDKGDQQKTNNSSPASGPALESTPIIHFTRELIHI